MACEAETRRKFEADRQAVSRAGRSVENSGAGLRAFANFCTVKSVVLERPTGALKRTSILY